jgi:hypothetical protein
MLTKRLKCFENGIKSTTIWKIHLITIKMVNKSLKKTTMVIKRYENENIMENRLK